MTFNSIGLFLTKNNREFKTAWGMDKLADMFMVHQN